MVIAFLLGLTIALIIAAHYIGKQLPDEAAKDKAKSAVAYGGTTDGKVIYDNLCTGCHTSGSGGAPTLDPSHWTARIAQGKETLYKHAIEGFTGKSGAMPARGGNPALTDEQMKATVDWMVAQAK